MFPPVSLRVLAISRHSTPARVSRKGGTSPLGRAAGVPKLAARPNPCPEGCNTALDHALITAPEARDPELLRKLEALLGRVLSG